MTKFIYYHRLTTSFKRFLDEIIKDAMLFMVCFAPILCGFLFRFALPFAEELLTRHFQVDKIISPYYQIFDLFLASVTPYMLCFVSAMVFLGEIDDGISNYLFVTPLRKSGYLLSRLGIPMILSIFVSIVILKVFSLTHFFFKTIILISILSSAIAILQALMIITLSTNKVEGMAIAKLVGLFNLGILAPYFIKGDLQYILFMLPSLWLAKLVIESKFIFLMLYIVTLMGWILFLLNKFTKKIR